MRQVRLSGNQPARLSNFFLPFSVTFGVGLVILLFYSLSPDRRVASAAASSTKDKQASSRLAATGTTDNGVARTADGLTGPASRTAFDTAGSGKAVASTDQPPDQGIWYENAAANGRMPDPRWSDPDTARYAATPNVSLASGLYESGASGANTGNHDTASLARSVNAQAEGPDGDAVPFTYPPRRIAWHQGFSVEQQWYRSWYGWGASETP